jgi:hypothetical protein
LLKQEQTAVRACTIYCLHLQGIYRLFVAITEQRCYG